MSIDENEGVAAVGSFIWCLGILVLLIEGI